MTNLTVVGAGDVLHRYIAGAASVADTDGIVIRDVIDVRPRSAIRASVALAGGDASIRVHEMRGLGGAALTEALATIPKPDAVIVATPTRFHVEQALAALEAGYTVALEKPYAASHEDAERFQSAVEQLGLDRVFLLGYYALEKGLPLLVLSRSGAVDPEYRSSLTPLVAADDWASVRRELGSVTHISGCILEGIGPKGGLESRQWLLEPDSGGITLEQFYHLLCLMLPVGESQTAEIENVRLMTERGVAQKSQASTGRFPAETLTVATLRIGAGTRAELAAGKYVPTTLHQRWMHIEYAHGFASMDFESTQLLIVTRDRRLTVATANQGSYATQLLLLDAKLKRRSMTVELPLFRSALDLALDLRASGMIQGATMYDSQELTTMPELAFVTVPRPTARPRPL